MAYTEFYAQTTGDNVNAGSTTNDLAAYTSTNGNWNSGTGVFTPSDATDPSLTVSVGDWASVYNDGATVAVFIGRVTNVTSTTITVSTTIKSGTAPTTSATGRSIKVGGAWKGPNGASGFPFSFLTASSVNANSDQPRVNIKSGTYSVSAAVSSTQGGIIFQGYKDTPGDLVNSPVDYRPVVDGGGGTFVILASSGQNSALIDIRVTNNTGANNGVNVSNGLAIRCVSHKIGNVGFGANQAILIDCEVYNWNGNNNSTDPAYSVAATTGSCCFIRCYAHDPNSTGAANSIGFRLSTTQATSHTFLWCIVAGANLGWDIAPNSNKAVLLIGCDAYRTLSDGFQFGAATSNYAVYAEGCNAFACGGFGFKQNVGSTQTNCTVVLNSCGSGSGNMANTNGRSNGPRLIMDINPIVYPAGSNPWVNAGQGDFRINNILAKNIAHRFTQVQRNPPITSYIDSGACPQGSIPLQLQSAIENWDVKHLPSQIALGLD